MEQIYVGVSAEGFFNSRTKDYVFDILMIEDQVFGTAGKSLDHLATITAFYTMGLEYQRRGVEPVFVTMDGATLFPFFVKGLRANKRHAIASKSKAGGATPVDILLPGEPTWSQDGNSLIPGAPIEVTVYIEYIDGKYVTLDYRDSERNQLTKVKVSDVSGLFRMTLGDFLEGYGSLSPELEFVKASKIEQAQVFAMTNGKRKSQVKSLTPLLAEANRRFSTVITKIYHLLIKLIPTIKADMSSSGKLGAEVLKHLQNITQLADVDGKQKSSLMTTREQMVEIFDIDTWGWLDDCYFGGHIQQLIYGRIDQPVYEYDINSAYPAVLVDLPSLRDARVYTLSGQSVERVREMETTPGLYCFVKFMAEGTHDRLGPLPSRYEVENTVGYGVRRTNLPTEYSVPAGEFLRSYDMGLLNMLGDIDVMVVSINPTAGKPFAFLSELYDYRQQVGPKSIDGKMVKLVINNVYGKIVQSIGNPEFASAFYGALITSKVREQLLEVAENVGIDNVVSFNTDALFTLKEVPSIDLGTMLGQWGCEVHENGGSFIGNGIRVMGTPEDSERLTLSDVTTRGFIAQKVMDKLASDIHPILTEFHETKVWDSTRQVYLEDVPGMLTLADSREEELYHDSAIDIDFTGYVYGPHTTKVTNRINSIFEFKPTEGIKVQWDGAHFRGYLAHTATVLYSTGRDRVIGQSSYERVYRDQFIHDDEAVDF